jgi:hypothetical protein
LKSITTKENSTSTDTVEIGDYNPMDISSLISEKNASKILMSTYKVPKTAQEISSAHDIPIAVCYRKMRQLEKLGLLRCMGSKLTREGKRVRLYQSQILYAHFFMEKGKFRATVQLTSGVVDDFGGSWSLGERNKE